jgi:sugar lactone lactonase YvrE
MNEQPSTDNPRSPGSGSSAAVLLCVPLLIALTSRPARGSTMSDVVAPDAQLEKVGGKFQLGESPLWLPDNSVLVSDLISNVIWRVSTLTGVATVERSPSHWANGQAVYVDGSILTAEHGGALSRTTRDGVRTVLVDRYRGKPLNSPNDLVVDPDGVVYFTDPPFGLMPYMGDPKRTPALGFSGVYRWDPRSRRLELLASDLAWPNGVGLSPDRHTLYVADSKASTLHAFELDGNGAVKTRRVLLELPETNARDGFTDSLKVDIAGRIFLAIPGGVAVISPPGQILGLIRTPEIVTNVGFGDKDGHTLYISGQTTLYRIRTQTSALTFRDMR